MERWMIPLDEFAARLRRAHQLKDLAEIERCEEEFVIADDGVVLSIRGKLRRVALGGAGRGVVMIRDCLWQIAVGAIVLALIAMPLTIVVRTLALLD